MNFVNIYIMAELPMSPSLEHSTGGQNVLFKSLSVTQIFSLSHTHDMICNDNIFSQYYYSSPIQKGIQSVKKTLKP